MYDRKTTFCMEIKFKIVNWNKYQKTRKETKNPYWVAIHNELWQCSEFATLGTEEKLVWYAILQIASKLRKGEISINTDWLARCAGVNETSVKSSINKIKHLGWICTKSVRIPHGICTESVQNTCLTIHNNTKQKTLVQKQPSPAAPVFDFSLVYQLYPRKTGKKAGLAKLARVIKTKEDYNALLTGVQSFADKNRSTELKYIPHFSTYVNQERWLDAADVEIKNQQTIEVKDVF